MRKKLEDKRKKENTLCEGIPVIIQFLVRGFPLLNLGCPHSFLTVALLISCSVWQVKAEPDSDRRLYVNELKAPKSSKDLLTIQALILSSIQNSKLATVNIELEAGEGSGVIISPEGLVMTAAHVTTGVGEEFKVRFEDGSEHQAVSLGLDSQTDAALAQLKGGGPYPYVTVAASDDLKVGHWVYALGYSGGFDKERGIVARVGRIVREAEVTIQSDCAVIGGDSGGPLFNLKGQLVGIHSRVSSSKEQNMHVPIHVYKENWERLLDSEFIGEGPFAKKPQPGTAFLGVRVKSASGKGLQVLETWEGSVAEKNKILVNDIIISVGDTEVNDQKQLSSYLAKKAEKEFDEVKVERQGETIIIKIRYGSK